MSERVSALEAHLWGGGGSGSSGDDRACSSKGAGSCLSGWSVPPLDTGTERGPAPCGGRGGGVLERLGGMEELLARAEEQATQQQVSGTGGERGRGGHEGLCACSGCGARRARLLGCLGGMMLPGDWSHRYSALCAGGSRRAARKDAAPRGPRGGAAGERARGRVPSACQLGPVGVGVAASVATKGLGLS
jgi:hypothetical protein